MHPPNITAPRVERSAVSRVGRPITSGTSLGGPAFEIGKTSIGERVKASQTAHVANERRRSLPPAFTKSTQLEIKKGKLTNRNASNQKEDEDSRRTAIPMNLIAFATLEDRGGKRDLAINICRCSGRLLKNRRYAQNLGDGKIPAPAPYNNLDRPLAESVLEVAHRRNERRKAALES
jgi:hypothetical protein